MELLTLAGILAAIQAVNKGTVLLVGFLFLLTYVLYRAHVNTSSFDLKDMIRNTNTGKADLFKFGQLVSLFITSWVIAFMASSGHLTEVYFGLYMLAWAGSTALNKYLSLRSGVTQESTTVTATVVSTKPNEKEDEQK